MVQASFELRIPPVSQVLKIQMAEKACYVRIHKYDLLRFNIISKIIRLKNNIT